MGTRKTKQIEGTEPEAKKRKKKAESQPEAKEGSKKKTSKVKKIARGKKYSAVKKEVESREYSLEEAVKKVKEVSIAGFDAAVDVHVNLGLESGKEEQRIRTFISLPHGTGKKIKVLVFAEAALAKKAQEAGADKIGDESLIEEISSSGRAPDFDVVVATPSFMPKIAKAAKILGPKGLMPSPKTGTVSEDPAKSVAELKKGKVELKTGVQPIIHVSLGKVSFEDKKLIENLQAVIEELNRVKPSKVREDYIKSVFLAPTMGPSIKVDLASLK
jgi:large subunit ribosomal protein L1